MEMLEQQATKLEEQDKKIKIQAAKLEEQKQEQNQKIEQLKTSLTNTFTNQLFYNSYTWKVNGFNRKFQRAKLDENYDPQERSFFTSKVIL